jgi:hypothetical protein
VKELNKRQRKKLDKKLFKAIKELNEDAVKDFDEPIEISEESLWGAFRYVKKVNSINQVFKTHRKFILNR